jgi:thymidylate synthase
LTRRGPTELQHLAPASAIGVFESAQAAWLASLARLRIFGREVRGVIDPNSVGSDFGTKDRPTRELLAASFTILNPRKRLFPSYARPIDLGFAFANVVWTLTGSNDLEMISSYNQRGRQFSDDGKTLFGAPGYRMFHSIAGDQFELARSQLRDDSSSRRAMIQLLTPADHAVSSKDHSCIADLQFLVREGKLTCIAHMRSQSALMVMPYDLILLTMIQEAMASSLKINVGAYHHFCGSLHYYLDEEKVVERAVHEDIAAVSAMPAMPCFDLATRELLSTNEKLMRRAIMNGQAPVLRNGLDAYWTELLQVMSAAFLGRGRGGLTNSDLSELPQTYRKYFPRKTT